jgi:quinol monooxygenase YgiN
MINRLSSSNIATLCRALLPAPGHAGKPANTPRTRTMHPNLMEMRMFGTVGTTKIKEGKSAEFEKVATELVKKVNENEKGCLLYQVYHGEVPNTYVFMERYADQAAIDAHHSSEYFTTLMGGDG